MTKLCPRNVCMTKCVLGRAIDKCVLGRAIQQMCPRKGYMTKCVLGRAIHIIEADNC